MSSAMKPAATLKHSARAAAAAQLALAWHRSSARRRLRPHRRGAENIDQLMVTFAGLLLMGLTAWFFWGKREKGYRATTSADGYQEATILVKGGYTPDTIVVLRGRPIRLRFRRDESSPCSETVVFSHFDRSARLPEGKMVPVELAPAEPGTYEFTCQMGMLRGRLIVN